MKVIVFILISSILLSCNAQEQYLVCFTGDVMLDRGIGGIINSQGSKFLSAPVLEIVEDYKFRIINLECPITSINNPITKPITFKANPSSLNFIKEVGITHVSVANNHINDQNRTGRNETLDILRSSEIAIGGIISKGTTCKPMEINDGNKLLAIFSFLDLQLSPQETESVCTGSLGSMSAQISDYKAKFPESSIIVYIHWGIEYYEQPTESQQNTAKSFIDAGADAIVGHHPHVIQKIDYYSNKPIFYSLGNFIFDQNEPLTKRGMVVGFNFVNGKLEARIHPYTIDDDFRPIPMSEETFNELNFSAFLSDKTSLTRDEKSWLIRQKKITPNVNIIATADSLAINDSYFKGIATISKLQNLIGCRLSLIQSNNIVADELYVPYPIYRFAQEDVDNDGKTDVLLGVIKSTHFDRNSTRRLFILRIDSGNIRPLWLGSKVCYGLIDFKPIRYNDRNAVYTFEKRVNQKYFNGIYRWRDFGLELIHMTSPLDSSTALLNFKNEHI